MNCVHRSLSYALQRFQATVKHRANTGMQAHGTEASMQMAMNAMEFDMLFHFPARQLSSLCCPDDITVTTTATTTTVSLNTLHAVFLVLCSGKLGSMDDAFGFSSLLTPMVDIGTVGQWDVSAGVPLYFDSGNLITFVPSEAGQGVRSCAAVKAVATSTSPGTYVHQMLRPMVLRYVFCVFVSLCVSVLY